MAVLQESRLEFRWALLWSCAFLALLLRCPCAAEEAGDSKAASRDAVRDLRQAIKSGSIPAVDEAVIKVARAGGASSMKVLLEIVDKVPPTEESLYWSLISGIASFVDAPAFKELGKFLQGQKAKPLAKDICYGLMQNVSYGGALALRPVALSGPEDLRMLAVMKLGKICSPDSVDILIEVLKAEEKGGGGKTSELAWMASEGLTMMTGENFGPASVNWEGWWKQNRGKPLSVHTKEDGQRRNTGTAVDSLDRFRREAFVGVEEAPAKSVVVLTAVYTKKLKRDLNNDRMERVLENMKVPHTVVRREDFFDLDLSGVGAILVNCAQFHDFCICPDCKPGGNKNDRLYRCTGCNKHIIFSAKLTDPEIQKITDFVMAGGYLFCEDWTVKEVLERAFPKFVAAGSKLKEGTVDVVPSRGMGTHPYLRGIFDPKIIAPPPAATGDPEEDELPYEAPGRTVVVNPEGVTVGAKPVKVKHNWKIDDESYALKVLDRSRVVTLLLSGKLQKDAEGDGVVALAFRPGTGPKSAIPPGQRISTGQNPSTSVAPGQRASLRGAPGVVVMALSHFGKQESSSDEHSIQNLLLNFLIEANVARTDRTPKTAEASRKAASPEKREKTEKKEGD